MVPHCAALHETVQVTPFPEASPVTKAVTGDVEFASMGFTETITETVIFVGVMLGAMLPPQPVMIAAEANAMSVRADDATIFICASETPSECTIRNFARAGWQFSTL